MENDKRINENEITEDFTKEEVVKKNNYDNILNNKKEIGIIIAIAIIIFIIVALFTWWKSNNNQIWILNQYKKNMQNIVLINSKLLKQNVDLTCQAWHILIKDKKQVEKQCNEIKEESNDIIKKLWKSVEQKIKNIDDKIKECNKKYIVDKKGCLNKIVWQVSDMNYRLIEKSNNAINQELKRWFYWDNWDYNNYY